MQTNSTMKYHDTPIRIAQMPLAWCLDSGPGSATYRYVVSQTLHLWTVDILTDSWSKITFSIGQNEVIPGPFDIEQLNILFIYRGWGYLRATEALNV